jgi:hypothetical protein
MHSKRLEALSGVVKGNSNISRAIVPARPIAGYGSYKNGDRSVEGFICLGLL